jgi:hypothetical protein
MEYFDHFITEVVVTSISFFILLSYHFILILEYNITPWRLSLAKIIELRERWVYMVFL